MDFSLISVYNDNNLKTNEDILMSITYRYGEMDNFYESYKL